MCVQSVCPISERMYTNCVVFLRGVADAYFWESVCVCVWYVVFEQGENVCYILGENVYRTVF